MKVLVVDVGGSNLKLKMSGARKRTKIPSGADLTPKAMMKLLRPVIGGWAYDVVTVGFPAPIVNGRPLHEPTNLGKGWMDFDFERAFGRPVRLLNDAAMQALGGYEGGRMLFVGLGTGLGSALVDDGHVVSLELCELRYSRRNSLEDMLSKKMLKEVGTATWQGTVYEVLEMLRLAFLPDYIMLGGGNAKHLSKTPDYVRIGNNLDALVGGERLWQAE